MLISWPKFRLLTVAIGISDVVWLAMMAWSRFFGVAVSCFVIANILQLVTYSIYQKRKAAGRYTNLERRPWKDQVW
jgi:uncharacterized membrane protein YGL010W